MIPWLSACDEHHDASPRLSCKECSDSCSFAGPLFHTAKDDHKSLCHGQIAQADLYTCLLFRSGCAMILLLFLYCIR